MASCPNTFICFSPRPSRCHALPVGQGVPPNRAGNYHDCRWDGFGTVRICAAIRVTVLNTVALLAGVGRGSSPAVATRSHCAEREGKTLRGSEQVVHWESIVAPRGSFAWTGTLYTDRDHADTMPVAAKCHPWHLSLPLRTLTLPPIDMATSSHQRFECV